MSLQAKILQLKLEAALAVKHAQGWQRLIDLYGEQQATAFYTHLGLNHLPAKSYDYEGLKLSREPKPHETLQVKAIASAQESAKERLATMMTSIRNELVTDALDQLGQLAPAKFHELVVAVADSSRDALREMVTATFNDGRLLIQTQRGAKAETWPPLYGELSAGVKAQGRAVAGNAFTKADDTDDYDDELDDLTDITTSRLANDVQARVTGAATRLALVGQSGTELVNAVTNEIHAASISYIDRAATGLANRTLNLGRSAEAQRFEWQRVEYSALLDANVCGPCADADGQEAASEDDLTPAPNPACEGYDNCRCVHVFVQD